MIKASWLCDRLEDLIAAGTEHHLVVDEALQQIDQAKDSEKLADCKDFKGTASRFESIIKCYIRSGRSDGQLIGLVSQSPNGTDLFGSAKTLQGLKIILCAGEYSSNRFQFFPAWAKQLFSELITPEIELELKSINSGFWHLSNTPEGLALNQTQQTDQVLVPCPPCHTEGFKPLAAKEPEGGADPKAEPADPSEIMMKAQQFIAKHGESSRAANDAGDRKGAIAYAYCGLLEDCLQGPVKLAGFGSKSRFVSRLFKAGVIDSRAKEAWEGHLQQLIEKGYLKADSEKLWIE